MQYNDVPNGLTQNPYVFGPYSQTWNNIILAAPSIYKAIVTENFLDFISTENGEGLTTE